MFDEGAASVWDTGESGSIKNTKGVGGGGGGEDGKGIMVGDDDRKECGVIPLMEGERTMFSPGINSMVSLSEGQLKPCSVGGEVTRICSFSSGM